MRHETELRVQVQQTNDTEPHWYPLDIGSGNTLTLDYVSNLLSDVSKITSSRSFTVKLPRTRRNDTAFDLAIVPQHGSVIPYRYLPCRVYVDGIDVAGEAYMYLVSAEAATYNAVIVFGLMQEYKTWVESGLGLKDLLDSGESIQWDWQAAYNDGPHAGMPDPWAPIWFGNDVASYVAHNGLSKAMYYGIYNPGSPLTWPEVLFANVHPFVTVREIWERIVAENSLNFTLPNWVKYDMEDLAIVLTKVSGNEPQSVGSSNAREMEIALDSSPAIGNPLLGYYYVNIHIDDTGYIEHVPDSWHLYKVKSHGVGPVYISFSFVIRGSTIDDLMERIGDVSNFQIVATDYVTGESSSITPVYQQVGGVWGLYFIGGFRYAGSDTEGLDIGSFQVRVRAAGIEPYDMAYYFSSLIIVGGPGSSQQLTEIASMQWFDEVLDYPNPDFKMIPNLPDIKQLDFVKMVCHLYGLFPCQRGGTVYFIPIDELEGNKPKAYDWSHYLLEDDPDAPHHTDWHMTDLARRNRVSYKLDEKDPVVDEAFLTVDDDTLEREKDFFTIPLAASDGDTINQYSLTPEYDDTTNPPTFTGYKVDFTECEHRLMRVVEWYNEQDKTVTRLAFQGLSSSYIIAERYAAYQAYINQPHILTERLRVPLADLRELDYSVPVFLSKYGRHFAVIDIKWTVTQDTCEAKLLML